jgi:hypothetical protein
MRQPNETGITLPSPETSPIPLELPTSGPAPQITESLSVQINVIPAAFYRIFATYDYASARLQIKQTIIFHAPAANLAQIYLVNEPELLAMLEWDSIQVPGYEVQSAEASRGLFILDLEQPLETGRPVEIQLEYTLSLLNRPARLGYTDSQANFGDWYLMLPPYISPAGWLVYPPAPVGEHLNYPLADFDIHLTVENSPPGLVWAASAPGEQLGENQYRFQLEKARNFAWSISPDYETSQSMAGDTQVISYYFPADREAGKAALDATVKAFTLYTEIFGDIQLPVLSLVEGEFLDGMEYDGLYFLGQEYYQEYWGDPRAYLILIAAHETAHQWFYAAVANDQASEPWLDEALCTYLELIFYEEYYPHLVDWWWEYRVKRFNPQGWVNSPVADHQQFRGYVDAVYLRGVTWLANMREAIGSTAFNQGLRTYFARYEQQFASGEDFLDIFREMGYDPMELTTGYFQPE